MSGSVPGTYTRRMLVAQGAAAGLVVLALHTSGSERDDAPLGRRGLAAKAHLYVMCTLLAHEPTADRLDRRVSVDAALAQHTGVPVRRRVFEDTAATAFADQRRLAHIAPLLPLERRLAYLATHSQSYVGDTEDQVRRATALARFIDLCEGPFHRFDLRYGPASGGLQRA